MSTMQRSRKYINMTDNEVVSLYVHGVKGESKYFLDLELMERGLEKQASDAVLSKIKNDKGRKKKIIWGILLFGMFVYRFFPKYFH